MAKSVQYIKEVEPSVRSKKPRKKPDKSKYYPFKNKMDYDLKLRIYLSNSKKMAIFRPLFFKGAEYRDYIARGGSRELRAKEVELDFRFENGMELDEKLLKELSAAGLPYAPRRYVSPSRVGKRGILVYVDEEVADAFNQLKSELNVSSDYLGHKGIALLLEHFGKPVPVSAERRLLEFGPKKPGPIKGSTRGSKIDNANGD